jgi:hypothetical protein
MKRILAGSALLLGVTLPAVVLGQIGAAHAATASISSAISSTTSGAKSGKATAKPAVTLPARVVVSGRTLKLSGSVAAPAKGSASAAAVRALSLWFTYPGSKTPVKIGGVSADSKGMLTVTAQLNAARIAMGLNTIQIREGASSSASATGAAVATVDVRRRSRVKIVNAVFKPTTAGFAAAVAVQVSHFDPKTVTYLGSRLSPIRLQELVGGTWVTRASATTNATGLATATFAATAGKHTYRAVRPNGATVWSATSPEITARTPVSGVA